MNNNNQNNMKNTNNTNQTGRYLIKVTILRRVIQFLCIILFPGVMATVLLGLHSLWSAVLHGNSVLSGAASILSLTAVVLIMTALFGRFFCGWICPFGALQDMIYGISSKTLRNSPTFRKTGEIQPAMRILEKLKFVVLIAAVGVVWTVNITAIIALDPWNAFGVIIGLNFGALTMASLLIFLICVLIAVFVPRFYCRVLCPLGAVLHPLSKLKIIKVEKSRENCGTCTLCSKKCPMGISLNEIDTVNSGECIQCLKCVEVCPRNNTHVELLGGPVNAKAAGCLTATAMTLVMSGCQWLNTADTTKSSSTIQSEVPSSDTVSNTSNENTTAQPNETVAVQVSESGSEVSSGYKDGTYTGSAYGYNRHTPITVQVEVKNGKISDVAVVSDEESRGFRERPIQQMPESIVESNSTDVDTVSGATFTSNGLINAVNNALESAQ